MQFGGVVVDLPNGAPAALARLTLNRAAMTRGTMPDEVAHALREAILDGLLPPGTWMREAEVARELKVSRTPIRDAFRILAAEALITITANQGAMVSAMTTDDVIELYAMRSTLEGMAARLAARRAARQCAEQFAELIPEMRAAATQRRHADLARLNFRFHVIVLTAAGNRYLERLLGQLQNAARRFPDPTLGLPGRTDASVEEHVELAATISAGNADGAERLAVEHMRRLSELRIRMLLER
jgi:DNA-binding GntR family transcriptional regulator